MSAIGATAAPPAIALKAVTSKAQVDTSKSAAASSATVNQTTATPPASAAADSAKAPAAASTVATKPLTGEAAIQAAKARYLRTGIDKDAAIGDPDHDAPRQPVGHTKLASSRINVTV